MANKNYRKEERRKKAQKRQTKAERVKKDTAKVIGSISLENTLKHYETKGKVLATALAKYLASEAANEEKIA